MKWSQILLARYFPFISVVNLLLSLVMVGFAMQIVLKSPVPDELTKEILQTQSNPFAPETHRQLAWLMGTYNKTGAQLYELQLAQGLGNVSKSETSLVETDRQAVYAKLTSLTSLKKFWTEITSAYPNYRDGWITLYMIGLELKDEVTIKQAAEQISYLDPNVILPQTRN